MARVYMAYSDYDKAQPLIERAVDLVSSNPSANETQGLYMTDLAWLYKQQGKLKDAETVCLKAIGQMRRTLGEKHEYLASALRISASSTSPVTST